MKVKIKELHANPFRSELGSYDNNQIKSIIESCKMSDFGKDMRFEVRKNEGKYELVYGHHRKEAIIRYYGKEHPVEIVIRSYDDDKMFVEMIRENLTHGATWFSKMIAFKAMKRRLELSARHGETQTKAHTRKDQGIGSCSIATALSVDSITVSPSTVSRLLLIGENLAPELISRIQKGNDDANKKKEPALPITTAVSLARFENKGEQRDLAKALKKSIEQGRDVQIKLLTKYKSAPLEEKTEIRTGKKDIAFVGSDVLPTKERKSMLKSGKEQVAKAMKALDGREILLRCRDLRDLVKKRPMDSFKYNEQVVLGVAYLGVIKELEKEVKEQRRTICCQK